MGMRLRSPPLPSLPLYYNIICLIQGVVYIEVRSIFGNQNPRNIRIEHAPLGPLDRAALRARGRAIERMLVLRVVRPLLYVVMGVRRRRLPGTPGVWYSKYVREARGAGGSAVHQVL
jgi:hypothetical protein